jgi:photosystem II stability/assembly factor-like uncharacterized protein
MLIVGVALKGLFSSTDGGASYEPLGESGAAITNRISWLAYDPTSADVFWESGIYNAGGVYKTTDAGATFTQVGDVTHCDSVSVDFGDPARKTLLAGSHEQARKLFRSTDSGVSWQDIGQVLPADSGFCTTSIILNATTFVVGCGGWYGGIARASEREGGEAGRSEEVFLGGRFRHGLMGTVARPRHDLARAAPVGRGYLAVWLQRRGSRRKG